MSADQKICEDATRSLAMAPPPPRYVSMEGLSRPLPDSFTHLPVNRDVCVAKEVVKRGNVAPRPGKQFCIDTPGNYQFAGFLRAVKALPGWPMNLPPYIP
jgi:hypothetical protein